MHESFLLAALEQAWLGRGFCAPNPSVGAVAVLNKKIIAQAWHHGAGHPHAEQSLLKQLPQGRSGISLYVTLEPCNHWGRTPPCVDQIIEYGIERVVYAYHDPNPLVSQNNTPALLQAKGIEVIWYPLTEITEFYRSYHHWILTQKPFVTAKIAQTFDGKIAGAEGVRTLLSNECSQAFTHHKRLHSDVILTTSRTVNQDNPLLNVRLAERTQSKPVAILDRLGILNPESNIMRSASHCHIYYDATRAPAFEHPNCTFYPTLACSSYLDLDAVFHHLGSLGYHDVWVEAGGTLFSALHQAQLVHKTYVNLVPRVLGSNATQAYLDIDVFKPPYTLTWESMEDNMMASFDWHRSLPRKESLCSRV